MAQSLLSQQGSPYDIMGNDQDMQFDSLWCLCQLQVFEMVRNGGLPALLDKFNMPQPIKTLLSACLAQEPSQRKSAEELWSLYCTTIEGQDTTSWSLPPRTVEEQQAQREQQARREQQEQQAKSGKQGPGKLQRESNRVEPSQ